MRQKIKIFKKEDLLKLKREFAIRNIMFDHNMVHVEHLLNHTNGELLGIKLPYKEVELEV